MQSGLPLCPFILSSSLHSVNENLSVPHSSADVDRQKPPPAAAGRWGQRFRVRRVRTGGTRGHKKFLIWIPSCWNSFLIRSTKASALAPSPWTHRVSPWISISLPVIAVTLCSLIILMHRSTARSSSVIMAPDCFRGTRDRSSI